MCCVLAVMTVGYLIDLQVMLSDYEHLVVRESSIKNQLLRRERSESATLSMSHMPDHSRLLREFVRLVSVYQSEIVSLVPGDSGRIEQITPGAYKIILSGNYAAIIQLLNQVAESSSQYEVGNFTMTSAKNNKIILEFTLYITDHEMPVIFLPAKKAFVRSPFCDESEDQFSRVVRADEAVHYSLDQMHLLGVVAHESVHDAVIEFPDGVIQTVANHALLGSEGGRVEEIYPEKVIVNLPSQLKYSLLKSH